MSRGSRVVLATVSALAIGVAIGIAASGGLTPHHAATATSATPAATAPGNGTPSPSASASPSPTPTETTPPDLAWGPTDAQWQAALATAQAMPEDEAIGAVLVVALHDSSPKAAAKLVRSRHLGGVILMGGSVPGTKAVRALTTAVQAEGDKRGTPVLIATDEEGGTVSRLSDALPTLPAFMAAGARDDAAATTAIWTTHAQQMNGIGITMDFAPDADVTIGLKDPTIRTRSASSDAERVSRAVLAASAGLEAGGVIPVVKHFPGHGSATSNSHVSLAYVHGGVAALEKKDLVPFQEAVGTGAPVVMMGHLVVKDWGKLPASVNPEAYEYLQDTMGFDGVTITDALDMEGVTDIFKPGVVEPKALEAGADLLLMPKDVDKAIAGIHKALATGKLSRERLDDAAAKAILLAQWQASLVPSNAELVSDTAYSAASAVVAAKDCSDLLHGSVSIAGGSTGERARLAKSLRAAGVKVLTGAKASGAKTTIALLSYDAVGADADVVVALGGPWALSRSSADVYVTAWGWAGPQLDAVARVLTEPGTAQGTWPVKLGLPYSVCG